MLTDLWLTPAALAIEACLGYPNFIYTRISHPVVAVGHFIAMIERRWNRAQWSEAVRRTLGVVAMVIVIGVTALVGYVLQSVASGYSFGAVALALLATTGLAQRSLYQHVHDVLQPLLANQIEPARLAVARIVGRDTHQLDESGVAAAAVESLAESFNDGVVAPAFWLFIGGLPGLFAYKAINTADSLIGHREPRWRAFGWAAARIDDAVNLVPARLSGLLLVIAGGAGFSVMRRDAPHHASPNAGWPEAAMAGALHIRIGGACVYDGILHERPVFGTGRLASVADLRRGLHLYVRACGLLWLSVLLACLAVQMATH
jgi:adenosylcobinamide-phosphate synthase